MSWDGDTAQTRIRLGARKPTDSRSREETPMSCIVRKYGGACFADRDGLLRVARQVLAGGELPAVIVVSARQGVTDQLSGQAQELGANPAHAARDLLLATGELQSAALLAAAVAQLGGRAEVVPPWSVFETTAEFGNATIEKVEVEPVLRCLGRGVVPIVPGFIGGTRDGRVTTLGRGGSDYSAVALGVALHAARVELCKAEVDGVYDADPHTHGHARRFDTLTYAEALRLSRSGAKVLQEKAAALAGRWAIPVLVRPAFAEGRGTTIGSRSEQFRAMPPRARPSPPRPPWAAILNRCLQFFVPGKGLHPSPRSTT
jgi:aspartokinase